METPDLTEGFHKQEYNPIDLEYVKEKVKEEELEKESNNITIFTDNTSSDTTTYHDPGFMESKTKEIELPKEKEDAVDSRICDKLKEVISSRPVLGNITERDNQAFAIIINKCLSVYNQEMQANLLKQVFYFDDILEKLHHKSYINALKYFKETCVLENKNDFLLRYKEELIHLMDESFKRISYHNLESRERLCETAQAQFLQKYKNLMEKSLMDEETENEYVQYSKFVKYSKFAEHEARISFLEFCGLLDPISNEVENCESFGFKEEMKKLRMSIVTEMKKYEDLRRLKKIQVEKQMDQKVEISVKTYKDAFERKLRTSNVSPLTNDEFKQIHSNLRETVLNNFKKETLTSILASKYAVKLDEKLRGQYKIFKKIAFKGHDDMIIDQAKVKLCSSIEKTESILLDSKALLDGSSSVSCVSLEMHIHKLEKVLKLLES